jgi:hypothetical protein
MRASADGDTFSWGWDATMKLESADVEDKERMWQFAERFNG